MIINTHKDDYNPYKLSRDHIIPAPTGWWQRIRYLGPGFVLSASIVGSGELIATTRLGAEAGFVTLWVILVSCLAKVAVQPEFGKHAIYTGVSTMQALNALPGWRMGKANWAIWTWLVLMTLKILQIGWLDFTNSEQRHKIIKILAWGFPLAWATLFLLMKTPVFMVTIGGVITTIILLIVIYAALHFRYRQLPSILKPGILYDTYFLISICAIVLVAAYGIYKFLSKIVI